MKFLLLIVLAAAILGSETKHIGAPWKFVGPGTVAASGNITASSAASAVIKVPGAWLLATVNGGVWRTTDALSIVRPHWKPVLDSQPVTCSSMTTLTVSLSSPNTVYAGCGASTSSQQGYAWNIVNGGDWGGIMISFDGGLTWGMSNFPPNFSVESIVELSDGSVLVAVRGGYFNSSNGGVWRGVIQSKNSRLYDWEQTFGDAGAYAIVHDNITDAVFAALAATLANLTVISSGDSGKTWSVQSVGLAFTGNMVPFYSCLTIAPGQALYLGVMLAPPLYVDYGLGGAYGQVFYLNLSALSSTWQRVGGQPMVPYNASQKCSFDTCTSPMDCCITLDTEYASKDRMAMLVHPSDPLTLYLVANWYFFSFRINVTMSLGKPACTLNMTAGGCTEPSLDPIWAFMWDTRQDGMYNWPNPPFPADTTTGYVPHVDCRWLTWDPDTNSLLMTSDGGVYVRWNPNNSPSLGFWTSFNGDVGSMELLSVAYDITNDRWIAAAQDNDVMVSVSRVSQQPTSVATSIIMGDGTTVAVDNATALNPRLIGCWDNLGGLGYVNSATAPRTPINIDLQNRGFPHIYAMPSLSIQVAPFFQEDFVLNMASPNLLYFWVNATNGSGAGPGVFSIDLDAAPGSTAGYSRLVIPTEGKYNINGLSAGGMLNGSLRQDVFVGVTGRFLITQYGSYNPINILPLPVEFAEPCSPVYVDEYCLVNNSNPLTACSTGCMSWPNHASSIWLAVADEWDSTMVAVTGWPSLRVNTGDESIWLTLTGGTSWSNITGNLAAATGTLSKARPSGMKFLSRNILAVSTTHGVFIAVIPLSNTGNPVVWKRLGTLAEFPLVKTQSMWFHVQQDVLLVATMGRGVYKLTGASKYFTAISPQDASQGLSGGVIFGIELGIVLFAVIVVGSIVFWIRSSGRCANKPFTRPAQYLELYE